MLRKIARHSFLLLLAVWGGTDMAAQSLSGRVTDQDGPVPGAAIQVKKNGEQMVRQYSITDAEGYYLLDLFPSDSLSIVATSPFHEPMQVIVTADADFAEVRDFFLRKRVTSIDEVLVKVKEKPVEKRGDTTIYSVDAFKDGSERVVEDLLKKLPGVTVTPLGEIQFKGQSIKKMLVDGDDLFDTQYKIGSKNIRSDMVEKVQAIEDFHENPLLKGIHSSGEVALNIKLKKAKSDISGTAHAGYGGQDRYRLGASGMMLNTVIKSFALVSANTLGSNPGPYNIQSEVMLDDEPASHSNTAREFVNPGNFLSTIDNQYSNFNRNLYTSINSFYKLGAGTTVRFNAGYFQDRLRRDYAHFSSITTPDESFETYQQEKFGKEPRIFDANVQVLRKRTQGLNWEYIGKFKHLDSPYFNFSNNNGLLQENKLESRNIFTSHLANLSLRLSDSTVMVTSGRFSRGDAKQDYFVTPGTKLDDSYTSHNRQITGHDKTNADVSTHLYHIDGAWKWMGTAGFSYRANLIVSELDIGSMSGFYVNDLDYTVATPFVGIRGDYQGKKVQFRIGIGLRHFGLKMRNFEDSTVIRENRFLPLPELAVSYKFSRKSSLAANYTFSAIEPDEAYVYPSVIQTGFRTFLSNRSELDVLKTHHAGLRYTKSYQMFNRLVLAANYYLQENPYLGEIVVSPEITIMRSFMSKTGNKLFQFLVLNTVYFHPLRTTFDANLNYGVNYFGNVVNDSELRDVTGKTLSADITMRRGIKKYIHLEAQTLYNHARYGVAGVASQEFSSLTQRFKFAYNSKKRWDANTNLLFFQPNLAKDNRYLFLNAEANIRSGSNAIEYTLRGVNLTDNKIYSNTTANDFAVSRTTHSLIRRYVLFGINVSF
jgi:hypothetical protein